jgi:MFS family permease
MLVCALIAVLGTLQLATTPAGLVTARIPMGLGSSCYLMAPLVLYARRCPPERFTVLAGIQIAIGTIGTLLVTAPLAWASAHGRSLLPPHLTACAAYMTRRPPQVGARDRGVSAT